MDPNANLKEQRELVRKINNGELTETELAEAAERLGELVEALDQWMVNGGFAPRDWMQA